MSTGTAASSVKVVLDTNILISGLGFRGKPRQVLDLALDTRANQVLAITSPILLAELEDVITKKFPRLIDQVRPINRKIRKRFKIVKPEKAVRILNDDDDNRVLEAAVEGKCDFIVTGDKELLELRSYKKIKIVTVSQFLNLITY